VRQGDKPPGKESEKVNFPFARLAKYLAIGLEIPSTIIGGVVLGYLIDLQFETSPWFTVVLAVLGFVGAVYRLLQYLRRFADERNES
jgi:F0F1-type ATP synthase assembly protein I